MAAEDLLLSKAYCSAPATLTVTQPSPHEELYPLVTVDEPTFACQVGCLVQRSDESAQLTRHASQDAAVHDQEW